MRTEPRSPLPSQLTVTLPPMRLYLTALLSRLTSTCRMRTCRRAPRPDAGRRCEPPRHRLEPAGRVRDLEVDVGLGRQRRHHAERIGHRVLEVDCLHRDHHLPRFDARQVEDVVDQRQQVRAGILDVLDAAELVDRRRPRRIDRSSCAKPSTALSGVLNSWLIRDRNSVLARFAASRDARACRSARAGAAR